MLSTLPKKIRVCLVCVCYDAYEDANSLLNSINKAYNNNDKIELWVVLSDNSMSQQGVELIGDLNLSFNYIYIKNKNIGYFPGFNRGVEAINKNINYFDYVMVSNVDLTIDNDFFDALYSIQYGADVGVIAPRIVSLDTDQDLNPKIKVRPSKTKILILRALCFSPVIFSLYKRFSFIRRKTYKAIVAENDSVESKNMYGAHGSFMIFTRNYFLCGANINYPRFLFGEEVFVAEEVRRAGLKISHETSLIIRDREHASTSLLPSKFICNEHLKSYDYFLENYLNKEQKPPN